MKLSDLRKMKMPSSGADKSAKPAGMALEIGIEKPRPGDSGEAPSLADASDMDLLNELKERGCIGDEEFDSISKHISGESGESAGESDESAY